MKIEPDFVRFGIDGGVHALFKATLRWGDSLGPVLFVGTGTGKCFCYLFKTTKLTLVYDDAEHRQIMALGEWPFLIEGASKNGEGSGGTSDNDAYRVWIHFRGSAVEVFECSVGDAPRFQPCEKIELAHYGFCKALDDSANGCFILPDYENNGNVLRIRYKAGGEKCYALGEHFLVGSYLRRQGTRRALNSEAIEGLKLFSGMLMDIQPNIDPGSASKILMTFEDSTVSVFDLRTKEVIDCLKHPKHHEFLALAVKKMENCLQIAVSVMHQVYLLKYLFKEEQLQTCCVIQRSKGASCSVMSFPRINAHSQQNLLACGFNNGIVDIFGIKPDGCGAEKMAVIEFHEGAVQCLAWMNECDVKEEEQQHPHKEQDVKSELCDDRLIVGSADGKLAFYTVVV